MTKHDLTLVFHSCDPGKDARLASGKSKNALVLALSRTYVSVQLVKAGLDVGVARCGADRMVRTFTPAQLNNPHLDPQRVLRTVMPCREEA